VRIALVAQNVVYGDGQGRINLEIARWALNAGAKVTLVAVEVDARILCAGAAWERIEVRRKPIFARVAQFPSRANRVIDRLRAGYEIDCVIANGYTLTRPHDVNLSQFVHTAWLRSPVHSSATRGLVNRAYQSFYTRYNAFHEKRSFRLAKTIVAPSQTTAAELAALGIEPGKVRVIPNGVDCIEFMPGLENRVALGLPTGVPLALFTGDVRTNRKGLVSVLQAMTKVDGTHLAVVGKIDHSPYPEMARTLGIADRTHFLGFRKDVSHIMRACDLFVFPSWYDPFGLVVTEALASGIPVVTSAATGAGELLTKECGTIISDPARIDELATAIKGWLFSPERRKQAAPACRAIAMANGWQAMAERYLELLPGNAGAGAATIQEDYLQTASAS
jgi:glycosyltransferase involved in cell wall biosynthesis